MSNPEVTGSYLGLLVRQVCDNMRARWEYELSRTGHDLNFTQFLTLKKLADGVASATELARIAEVNPGAMTRLLDRLESRGLVARAPDPADRRALRIELTEDGRRIARDIAACSQRVRDAALQGMDANQRGLFIRLLEQVRDNLSLPEP